MYSLPDALRAALARPFAPVLSTAEALRFVEGRIVYAVGDVVTQTFLDAGVVPHVMVVDGVTKRATQVASALTGLPPEDIVRIEVENPAARITRPLWDAVERAAAAALPTLIHVIGEEDLAALPAMLFAPDGAVVCYGQPDEGVVAVIVDADVRERVRRFLDQMEVK